MPSTSPLGLLLRKLEAHSPLHEEDRRAILALPHRLKTLEPHSYILREGDSPEACTFLASGYASRHKQTGGGARQIVAFHIPGDPLDFQNLFLDAADHNVQTITRAEVATVPRAEVQKLLRTRSAVAQAFLVLILIEASIFREWVLNLGRRSAPPRLAHLLCELGARLEGQGIADGEAYELPISQEQLGDALGLTPVHVHRTLRALEADGFVERDRRRIRVPNWRRMREFGDFNQRYLHMEAGAGG